MSEQASISFVPVSPVAHRADPGTSYAAARQVTRDGTRKRQADEVLRLVRAAPGLTSYELADNSAEIGNPPMDRYQIARRLSELADPQNGGPFIERGEARECRITGRMAITWRAR